MDGLKPRWMALPEPAPLAMPAQSLSAAQPRPAPPASSPPGMAGRRFAVLGGAVALTAFATWQMALVLDIARPTALQIATLALFVVLFAWVALSFTSAMAGLWAMRSGGVDRLGVMAGPMPVPATRTALLMPVYNEPPHRVMAGLRAMHESLSALGAMEHFDIFILSDTTDPDAWVAEEAAFLELRRLTGDEQRIFYRRRTANTERKAGNIAEWVTRFGDAYPQFLILDADSLMEGEALVRLAAAMERHPDVGLIQTLPVIVQGRSLLARMQQFAGRLYGPVIAQGIAWWHGAEGNYWGHNAMIRTRAFAGHAGLPHLKGRAPFGGMIMSHDFVEAALLRRAGWAVHMVPGLRGSYEETPPSLPDQAVRDRRWCQGNLQHAAVLPARGLHPISRLHLLSGIGSYLTAPLWALFLLVGVASALEARYRQLNYFPNGRSLFPEWPVVDPIRAMWLFIGTMALLFLPKLLAIRSLRQAGGMLLESVVAALLAPVTMLSQSMDVLSILSGRDGGWRPQRRDDGHLPWRDLWRLYWPHTLAGAVFGVASWLVSPWLAAWTTPVTLGLLLAVPLAGLTARDASGLRVLDIEEDVAPPALLRRAAELRAAPEPPEMDAVRRLADDPALLQAHRAMLPPPRRRGAPPDVPLLTGMLKAGEAECLRSAALSRAEKAALLASAEGLDELMALTSRPA
ncbi:glucans biosynthesis glucosyltransferase MdoH [Rhodovarius crocodyli]|uniref:Glucans biosynthesis glucosyltransferase H n=1 Tax=Rhodovarius crocodyli TaxID=1979269 RepID=A0A437LXF2_9PROT|nr:glucans biosynthesis glucosyltransferase MdoH [Rhodovarius crocodyli]RVT90060.1 glucans biosynthesis glucosyltransferase MdoH [Rhodovarius crocodyli]